MPKVTQLAKGTGVGLRAVLPEPSFSEGPGPLPGPAASEPLGAAQKQYLAGFPGAFCPGM